MLFNCGLFIVVAFLRLLIMHLACEFMFPGVSATLINIPLARFLPSGEKQDGSKQSPSSLGRVCAWGERGAQSVGLEQSQWDGGSVCSCFNFTSISTVKSRAVIVPRQRGREAESQNLKFFYSTSLLSISSLHTPILTDEGRLQDPLGFYSSCTS